MIYILYILITATTLLCFYIIAYVGLGVFEPLGVSDEYKQINNVALNLSYSYIAGLIFYLFTSKFPHSILKAKYKKPIREKIDIIALKMEESLKVACSSKPINNSNITKAKAIEYISNKPLQSACSYNPVIPITVIDFLRGQREDIRRVISQLREYRDYMSSDALRLLESITECEYFYFLNLTVNATTDIPQVREKMAEQLWTCLSQARKLKKMV